MAFRLIRENSDTPNVTNKDDVRMIRYAYGGQNGYVKGMGAELNYMVNGNVFTINSGVINLQGWEVEIDSNGWSTTLSASDAAKKYFAVYCEVNLTLGGSVKIETAFALDGYPEVSEGDDLTVNPSGLARIVLYKFIAQSGNISEVTKIVGELTYVNNQIALINKRLDDMGFKEASVENGDISVSAGWTDAIADDSENKSPEILIVKMAKFALLKTLTLRTISEVNISSVGTSSFFIVASEIAKIPESFIPLENTDFFASIRIWNYSSNTYNQFFGTITVNTDGTCSFGTSGTGGQLTVSSAYPAILQCENAGWQLP